MLVLNMENGLPGRIGLHVHRHARIANPIRETSREKPDQELAPTLHQPMVAMTVEAVRMMSNFATTTCLVVSSPLVGYFVKFSPILRQKKFILYKILIFLSNCSERLYLVNMGRVDRMLEVLRRWIKRKN